MKSMSCRFTPFEIPACLVGNTGTQIHFSQRRSVFTNHWLATSLLLRINTILYAKTLSPRQASHTIHHSRDGAQICAPYKYNSQFNQCQFEFTYAVGLPKYFGSELVSVSRENSPVKSRKRRHIEPAYVVGLPTEVGPPTQQVYLSQQACLRLEMTNSHSPKTRSQESRCVMFKFSIYFLPRLRLGKAGVFCESRCQQPLSHRVSDSESRCKQVKIPTI